MRTTKIITGKNFNQFKKVDKPERLMSHSFQIDINDEFEKSPETALIRERSVILSSINSSENKGDDAIKKNLVNVPTNETKGFDSQTQGTQVNFYTDVKDEPASKHNSIPRNPFESQETNVSAPDSHFPFNSVMKPRAESMPPTTERPQDEPMQNSKEKTHYMDT